MLEKRGIKFSDKEWQREQIKKNYVEMMEISNKGNYLEVDKYAESTSEK